LTVGVRQKLELLIVTGPRTAGFTLGKQALDFWQQAIREVALMNETVRAMAAAFVCQREAVKFGENDHPQARTGEADLLCSLQSVNPRHAEIEENQVWPLDGCKLNCMQAVSGGSYNLKPPGKLQVIPHGPKCRDGIVCDEDTNRLLGVHLF
jgi:hypothetical protein